MNVIFDIDDTLYNQLTIFENAYNEVFKRYYNFYVSDIFKSNIKYAGECFEKKEAGTMSTEEMYRYRITKAFGDYGINISTDDSEKFQQSYMKQQKLIKITEGIEEVLNYGKENNITMSVITNVPEDTYYVGDSLTHDVIGTKRAGWKVIWMNRMNYQLLEGFPVDN